MSDSSQPRFDPALFGRMRAWLKANRIPILFALLLLVLLPARGLWAPDEPDFAQCIREMRERGSWALPYLNGLPYSEKPILFYWLMKASAIAGDWLTNGYGFIHGISAWALRVPSVLAAILFAFGFRRWITRFEGTDGLEVSSLILFTTPIWIWQAQTIQIDMLFAALLAWSWLCWVGGYLLATGRLEMVDGTEGRRWLVAAYLSLALAVLAKGPLALVLTGLVVLAFLAWQKEWRTLGKVQPWLGLGILIAVVIPWYVAARLAGGPIYFHELVIVQNFQRATHAWDHIQPWWRYFEYITGDFWPWVLFLPVLFVQLIGSRKSLSALQRFEILAFLMPFLFLSWSQSKQGKYLLPSYPFLALLIPSLVRKRADMDSWRSLNRWLGWALSACMWLIAVVAFAAAFTRLGGAKFHMQVLPFLGPLRVAAVIAFGGAIAVAWRAHTGRLRVLIRDAALTLGALYLVVGAWGFRLLDSAKTYHRWTEAVAPAIAGRKVYFWQTIRSGAMVYTDHLMPELHSLAELESTLGPEDRLVTQDREWNEDAWGMTPQARMNFEVLLRVPTGSGELLLIRKRQPQGEPPQ